MKIYAKLVLNQDHYAGSTFEFEKEITTEELIKGLIEQLPCKKCQHNEKIHTDFLCPSCFWLKIRCGKDYFKEAE